MKGSIYYWLLLILISIRIGSHTMFGLFGLTGFFDMIETIIISGYTVIYSLSFIGIYRKEMWVLPLFIASSLMDGLVVLTNISSINDVIQILFWDGFGIYLAYRVYQLFRVE